MLLLHEPECQSPSGFLVLQVIVKDFADLRFRRKYDRVLLIEMLGPPETHKVRTPCMLLAGCFVFVTHGQA